MFSRVPGRARKAGRHRGAAAAASRSNSAATFLYVKQKSPAPATPLPRRPPRPPRPPRRRRGSFPNQLRRNVALRKTRIAPPPPRSRAAASPTRSAAALLEVRREGLGCPQRKLSTRMLTLQCNFLRLESITSLKAWFWKYTGGTRQAGRRRRGAAAAAAPPRQCPQPTPPQRCCE